jgi:hypothetical protein
MANLNGALTMSDTGITTGLVDNHGAVSAGEYSSIGTTQGEKPTIAGAAAGVSLTAFVSNAKSIFDLEGPFQTATYNLGVISFQYSTDGSTNVFSVSAGPAVGASYTNWTTETTVGCISGCN